MYDVIIIGAGVTGCATAYELSKYNTNVLLLEKENDVSMGTTKANSAIIHAGYDPDPGTDMAKYNVKGNEMIRNMVADLDVPFQQIGSLVVAFSEEELGTLKDLYDRGVVNGVPDMEIWDEAKLKAEEPNIASEAKGALFAPTAGIISPWDFALAMAEVAVKNGVELKLNTKVENIEKVDGGYKVTTNNGTYEAKFICNAAGVQADQISEMVNEKKFTITPNKGEYYLLDKSQGELVNHVIFQCPNAKGKGVLVAPTVHGNLIVGPNSENTDEDDLSTTLDGLAFVSSQALKSVPSINYRESIRNFAGLRARTGIHDYFIYEGEKGFFNLAGMASPGLSSAPAVAVDVVEWMQAEGLSKEEKADFDGTRKVLRFKHLSHEERAEAVKNNPLYGKIICRCETITEGEIVDALHRNIVPTTIDGIKRRCNPGMGRCQGGFCGPRVQEIIARELNMPLADVVQDRNGTVIITGETKTGGAL